MYNNAVLEMRPILCFTRMHIGIHKQINFLYTALCTLRIKFQMPVLWINNRISSIARRKKKKEGGGAFS